MSAQSQPTITTTVVPAADIAKHRFVTWAGVQATADEDCMGISFENLVANRSGLVVMGVTGIIEAGAVIDGSVIHLKSDANGRAIPCTVGDTPQAVLKAGQTAGAVGDQIEVFPLNPIAPLA
ncbi:MAG: hypothetical protein AAFY26_02095 [Cyanobacteria bacterium J06638_22]